MKLLEEYSVSKEKAWGPPARIKGGGGGAKHLWSLRDFQLKSTLRSSSTQLARKLRLKCWGLNFKLLKEKNATESL